MKRKRNFIPLSYTLFIYTSDSAVLISYMRKVVQKENRKIEKGFARESKWQNSDSRLMRYSCSLYDSLSIFFVFVLFRIAFVIFERIIIMIIIIIIIMIIIIIITIIIFTIIIVSIIVSTFDLFGLLFSRFVSYVILNVWLKSLEGFRAHLWLARWGWRNDAAGFVLLCQGHLISVWKSKSIQPDHSRCLFFCRWNISSCFLDYLRSHNEDIHHICIFIYSFCLWWLCWRRTSQLTSPISLPSLTALFHDFGKDAMNVLFVDRHSLHISTAPRGFFAGIGVDDFLQRNSTSSHCDYISSCCAQSIPDQSDSFWDDYFSSHKLELLDIEFILVVEKHSGSYGKHGAKIFLSFGQ